jgi:hypothetical protein
VAWNLNIYYDVNKTQNQGDKMKKVLFLVLAALLLTSAIAIPAYSAVIKNPIVVMGDDPVPPPPPPK